MEKSLEIFRRAWFACSKTTQPQLQCIVERLTSPKRPLRYIKAVLSKYDVHIMNAHFIPDVEALDDWD